MKKTILTMALMLVACWSWANHWVVDDSQFSNYMTVTCVVQINGEEQYSTQLELGAFCGNEVRGSIYGKKTPTNRYFFMLPCWGGSGDEFHFRLYDAANDVELDNYVCATVLSYDQNGYGGLSNPYVLNFEGGASAFHFTTAGNWSVASNWQGNAVPGTTDEVSIDANCTLDQDVTVASLTITDGNVLTIQSGKVLNVTGDLVNTIASGLVIKDGAQLINASENVAATLEKDVAACTANDSGGWYTISSPINGMSVAGSAFLTPSYDLYRYNETSFGEEWENYKASLPDFTSFENGRGYLYANSNSFSPAFTGILNNTNVNYDVTYTDRTDGLSGFNLIGNPFPHAIYKGAGGAIDNSKLASGYYTLTNEGAWHVHTFEDSIAPGQGLLVKTLEAAELSITKSTTAATAESSSKDVSGRMDLTVSGDNGEDRAFVYFSHGVGLEKMAGFNDAIPALYIRNDQGDFAIAHANTDCVSLNLMFRNRQSGKYTLGVAVNGVRFSYLHLFDHVAGVDVDLLQNPNYNFTATGHENEHRFTLRFKVMTAVNELNEDVPFAFVKDGQIIITGVETGQGVSLQVVDMAGRVIVSRRDGACAVSTANMAPGVYVLRLVNDNNVMTQKIVVK